MSEMVERVARAICDSVGKDPDAPFKDRNGKALDFPEWARWQGEARAAIRAMWDPTPEMTSAASDRWTSQEGAAYIWRKMINAVADTR